MTTCVQVVPPLDPCINAALILLGHDVRQEIRDLLSEIVDEMNDTYIAKLQNILGMLNDKKANLTAQALEYTGEIADLNNKIAALNAFLATCPALAPFILLLEKRRDRVQILLNEVNALLLKIDAPIATYVDQIGDAICWSYNAGILQDAIDAIDNPTPPTPHPACVP
jgi:hypothetical protein